MEITNQYEEKIIGGTGCGEESFTSELAIGAVLREQETVGSNNGFLK